MERPKGKASNLRRGTGRDGHGGLLYTLLQGGRRWSVPRHRCRSAAAAGRPTHKGGVCIPQTPREGRRAAAMAGRGGEGAAAIAVSAADGRVQTGPNPLHPTVHTSARICIAPHRRRARTRRAPRVAVSPEIKSSLSVNCMGRGSRNGNRQRRQSAAVPLAGERHRRARAAALAALAASVSSVDAGERGWGGAGGWWGIGDGGGCPASQPDATTW